ncbi:carbohydrate ABC transporter permease [Ruminococcus sp.]|uniref:carbohydrate ABC transporter permease n=1 Tax=Ruminococcus sp. TaxID=41978 RepID=UPI0025899ACD|nr:carbohydrate ABC transporter permease [Ruminococcus sp.]MCR5021340.1 carbohydrate ABC transporter permease [Ruminococcus sp.]
MAELTKKVVSTPSVPIPQAEKPKRDAKDIGSKTKHSIVSRRTKGDNVFDVLNTLFMIVFTIVIMYPLLNMIAVSFNDGLDALKGGITLFPRVFTLKNYQHVLSQQNMLTAAKISVLRTVIGTVSSTLITALLAYVLSRKEFLFKKQLSLLYVVTMYVSGGLIPIFLVYKALGLVNSFMVYILPGMVPAFSMLVLRTYMNGLPDSLAESAMMDGAGHLTIFIKIIFPLCMPVIATVALFTAVGQWNSWFDAMLYNRMNDGLSTLQYELMKTLASVTSKKTTAESMKNASATVTPTSVRAAATVVTALPIVILYPFLQRYFVAGLTIGGVKE